MDYKAPIVASCWLAVALISSVYMLVSANKLGDVFFGLFLPVGALVLVALAVTFIVASSPTQDKQREPTSSSDFQSIKAKLAEITGEIEKIKKQVEQ